MIERIREIQRFEERYQEMHNKNMEMLADQVEQSAHIVEQNSKDAQKLHEEFRNSLKDINKMLDEL